MLLDLGNDITRVREKNDLLVLFSKRIRSLFYFTHTIVTLIDYKDETYTPFLLDNENSPIRGHAMYPELIKAHFSLNEPFIQAVLHADEPISFWLADIMDQPKSPSFLRVNHEEGVKEILMTRLMKEGKPMGLVVSGGYTEPSSGLGSALLLTYIHDWIRITKAAESRLRLS